MPTIINDPPFRVLILNPPREHRPAHVHVLKGKGRGESEVLIDLGRADAPGVSGEPISIREVKGMRNDDVVAAAMLVQQHIVTLRQRWREIHGEE